MKKYIVLVVTTLILTGLAGCSMTKNRYNHYGVVKYLENKYDDKFEYYETYGGTLFDSDSWKKFICTSEKYPGKHILVIYDVKYKKYHDNYLDYFAYRNDVIRKGKKSRHFYAKMKDNKTFTECYWEVD